MTFISDIGIGYRVRPHVDIGYRHFPKFTYRSDTIVYYKVKMFVQHLTSSGSEMSTFVCEGALIATTVCSSNSLMLRTSLLVTYAYVHTAKEEDHQQKREAEIISNIQVNPILPSVL